MATSESISVDEFYKRKAKDLTNMLFDKGFLSNDLSREAIDWLEDYLGFILQSEAQMSAKAALLTKKRENYKVRNYVLSREARKG